jgi:hypothetical protein
MEDSTVILAVHQGVSNLTAAFETILEAGLGTVADNNVCITTTSTTTAVPPTTTTTTTALIP